MPAKTTTPKPAAKSKPAAKASPRVAGGGKASSLRRMAKAMPVQPEVAAMDTAPEMAAEAKSVVGGLRLKDLIERVVAATGGKRKGVKEIVEAVLTQMGDALQRGETLHLPNFGKARVAKAGAEGSGALTVKLRRMTGSGGKGRATAEDKDALAAETDQG